MLLETAIIRINIFINLPLATEFSVVFFNTVTYANEKNNNLTLKPNENYTANNAVLTILHLMASSYWSVLKGANSGCVI